MNNFVSPSSPSKRGNNLLAVVVLISLLVGGASGAAFGVLTSQMTRTSGGPAVSGSTTTQNVVEDDAAAITAVEKVSQAVVSVVLTQDLSKVQTLSPLDLFFSPFQQTPQQGTRKVGAATGFLVTSDGMIVTNRHVVNQENVDVTVVFTDKTEHVAKVLAIDPVYDLAVIKIEGKDLPVLTLGDSDSIKLGQTVIAIGNALGKFQNTVTKGVVSGIGRSIIAGDNAGLTEQIDEAIQTDAAINEGNSGGPLINLAGQVVGINTAMSQEGQLVGFAIPINTAKQVIDSVQKSGKIVRPYLGIRYLPINKIVQEQNGLSVGYGVLVVRGSQATELAVVPGGPADKAGIEENDILLEINGQKITEEKGLATMIRKFRVGETVTLKLLHDGKEKTVTVQLEEYKSSE